MKNNNNINNNKKILFVKKKSGINLKFISTFTRNLQQIVVNRVIQLEEVDDVFLRLITFPTMVCIIDSEKFSSKFMRPGLNKVYKTHLSGHNF